MTFIHSRIFGTQSTRTFPNKTNKQNMFIRVPIKRSYISEYHFKFNIKMPVFLLQFTVKKNSVALVRKRTIPTDGRRPSAKLVPTFADRGVSRGQRNGSPRPF